MKTSDIRGIIPPVITPMNNDPEQTAVSYTHLTLPTILPV